MSLDDLEATGQATRAARKAKTPERKAKRNRGRAQKARGYRAEKRVEKPLAVYGFKRQVMSGALGGDLAGDLALKPMRPAPVAVIEVKHRDRGWPVLRRHLAQGKAHALILEEGERAEPLVVVTLSTFTALLDAAPYPRDDAWP